jgi:hypothetical protein
MVTIAMDEVQQQQRIMEEVCHLLKRWKNYFDEIVTIVFFLKIINGCWDACVAPSNSVRFLFNNSLHKMFF